MTQQHSPAAPAAPLPFPPAGSAIMLCPDGVYRWSYEFSMYRNPTLLFTVWKAMGLAFGLVWLFVAGIDLFENGFDAQSQLQLAGVFLLVFAGVGIVLGGLSYLILAAVYGGKYCVVFEMNGQGVRHSQMPKQFKKAQVLGAIAALAGVAGGSFTAAGAGMLAASRSTMYTEFAKVRGGRVVRKRSTIFLSGRLERNQIYAEPQDFDFVLWFIRCCVPADVAARLQG